MLDPNAARVNERVLINKKVTKRTKTREANSRTRGQVTMLCQCVDLGSIDMEKPQAVQGSVFFKLERGSRTAGTVYWKYVY